MRHPLNTIAINGWDTLYGAGEASVLIDADGAEQTHKEGRGEADVTMDAADAGVIGVGGSGLAAIEIEAAGDGRIAVRAYSDQADIEIEAVLAIVRPAPKPEQFVDAPPSRRIFVGMQGTEKRVQSEDRTVRVQVERRVIFVSPDRGI